MKNGIDLSVHNGVVNMNAVKSADIDFVIIRDGYGDLLSYPSQKDPRFEQNYANAKAAGLHVGTYHYLYATTARGARREAEGFLANIKGKQFDFPVALDIEERTQYDLPNATVEAMVKAFMDVCEAAGYYCALYSYESFLTAKMSAGFRAKYDVWCANISREPSIAYGIWQYSFTGSVDGCSGRVDMNRTSKDYPQIIKNGGFNGYPKPEALKELDKPAEAWWKHGDKLDHGLYAVKRRMKALGYGYLDLAGGFGGGTEKAVNDLLRLWGYKQNGVIGEKFVDIVMK